MNIKYIFLALIILCLGVSSCAYLDIVPDEKPTEADAFKDANAAERYLYSCYAFMNQERHGVFTSAQGEYVSRFGGTSVMEGTYTAANPTNFRYWSKYYGGIKRCYQLLNNVDGVPHMNADDKTAYKAEAKFLIAYFHFILLRSYGPCIVWDKELPTDITAAEMPKRSKFDDCVTWIAAMLDDAETSGLVVEQPRNSYGRATSIAAKALKARLYLYAASPLFNGNSEFYADFVDPETSEPLVNQVYDKEKWKKAYDAAIEAIAYAKANGISLYRGAPTISMPEPSDPTQFALRMTFVDRENNEVIWCDTRREEDNYLQNQGTPRDLNSKKDLSWNGLAPTLEMVKTFYTENGLPIEEDPEYYAESEYFEQDNFLSNGKTAKLHLKREPRFLAWISFHNGTYELSRNNKKSIVTQFGKNDTHGWGDRGRNYSATGYLWKKGIPPTYSTETGVVQYAWPLFRLAELYLNAAEAAAEYGMLTEAKENLNEIRLRAGIPTVENSWKGKTLDQAKLIQIIHQERDIELCLEGHHGWDLRRWKEAKKEFDKNPHGLNIGGDAVSGSLFRDVELQENWHFNDRNYLLPIPTLDLNANSRLVQNPGYE